MKALIIAILSLGFVAAANAQRIGRIEVKDVGTTKDATGGYLTSGKKMEASFASLEEGNVVVEVMWTLKQATKMHIAKGASIRVPFDNVSGKSFTGSLQGWLVVVRNESGEPLGYKAQNASAEAFYKTSEAKRLGQSAAGINGIRVAN